jgi:hypothetical protein
MTKAFDLWTPDFLSTFPHRMRSILAFWSREHSCPIVTRNIQSWILCWKKILVNFDRNRAQNRPKNNFWSTFVYLDNVTFDQASRDFDRLGITKHIHPPCSPDLAPCDFWLFGTLKRKLERCAFADLVEIMIEANIILSKIPLEKFILVFDE